MSEEFPKMHPAIEYVTSETETQEFWLDIARPEAASKESSTGTGSERTLDEVMKNESSEGDT